jgi:hypothetical protein
VTSRPHAGDAEPAKRQQETVSNPKLIADGAPEVHVTPVNNANYLVEDTAILLQELPMSHHWQEVAVDLIGPWTINLHGRELKFNAVASIDAVSNCPEIVCLNNKTSQHVAQLFENSWLSRHPHPVRCICYQGPEFIGHEF